MSRPTFIFDSNGELVSVDPDGEPPDLESFDVLPASVAFDIDGNVLAVVVEQFTVVLKPTGRSDLPTLLNLAGRHARAVGLDPEVEDDLLLAVANHELRSMWDERWPKRPRWLARRLHGDQPPAPFTRT